MTAKSVFIIYLCFMVTSCATRKKTIVYSAIASAFAGAIIGKAVSPNKESAAINMAGGLIIGSIVGGVYGDSVYKDRHPDFEMKEIPINTNKKVIKITQGHLESSMLGIPSYSPLIASSTDRKYIKIDKKLEGIAQKQYVIEHRIERQSITREDGTKFIFPAIKITEVGVENE